MSYTLTHIERKRVDFEPPIAVGDLAETLRPHLADGWIPDRVLWTLEPDALELVGMECVRGSVVVNPGH